MLKSSYVWQKLAVYVDFWSLAYHSIMCYLELKDKSAIVIGKNLEQIAVPLFLDFCSLIPNPA